MVDNVLLALVLALATNEVIHNLIESLSARYKVRRLSAYINKLPVKELPINIDSRQKSYMISFGALIVPVLIFFAIYLLIDLEVNTALKLIIGLLVAAYSVSVVSLDQFHVEIEKITKPFKNKKN